jgi:hypothetical protein
MKKIGLYLLFAGAAILDSSCYYDKFNELHPLDGYVETCDPNLPNTYTETIRIILLSNCISCHNSDVRNGDVVLETYSQVKEHVQKGDLMGSILHENGYQSMPPGTSLRNCDIDKIQQWITAGLPE